MVFYFDPQLIFPACFVVYKRNKDLPFIGTVRAPDLLFHAYPKLTSCITFQAHATDLVDSFGPGELRDYVLRFTNNLDPNGKIGLGIPWPQWDPRNPKAVIFQDDSLFPVVLGDDNYRTDPLNYVTNMSLIYPI